MDLLHSSGPDPRTRSLRSFLCLALFLVAGACLSSPMARIQLRSVSGISDETVFYYQQGSTPGFDPLYDAYKLFTSNSPCDIALHSAGVFFAVNGIEPVQTTFTMELRVRSAAAGVYTIQLADFDSLPPGTSVLLKDNISGEVTDLVTEDAELSFDAAELTRWFVVTIQAPAASMEESTPQARGKKCKTRIKCMPENVFTVSNDCKRISEVSISRFSDSINVPVPLKDVQPEGTIMVDLGGLHPGSYILTIKFSTGDISRATLLLKG